MCRRKPVDLDTLLTVEEFDYTMNYLSEGHTILGRRYGQGEYLRNLKADRDKYECYFDEWQDQQLKYIEQVIWCEQCNSYVFLEGYSYEDFN